jgi:CheY-like chemotaxis protein
MKTILIADDAPEFRTAIVLTLQMHGYEVRCAFDGRQALDMIQERTPDLLLLDVAMPVVDGLSVLRTLRASEQWRNLPVILLTAMSEKDCLASVKTIGVQGYLVKSRFSLAEMVSQIQAQFKDAA